MNIRKPAVAGRFYPGDKQELSAQLNHFFNQTEKVIDRKIKALIVPHAGYVYSGQTAAYGFRQLSIIHSQLSIILVGPSHHFYFENLVSNDFDFWQTPLGIIKHQLSINKIREIKLNNDCHIPEHSLEVQLPFLQTVNKNISMTCFLTGSKIEEKKLAEYFIKNYSDSLFIFSSDLSHYLPENMARKKDKATIEAITKLHTDYFRNGDNVACGDMGITILLEMAKIKKWKPKLIYYDTSATFSGDTSQVVGYAAIGFC